ncbi:MAG: EAL domain-containing protein, partial [Hydrogenovibrio sp.]|nr:EAL domain-containing protein [Hydrogenovibrio sp.]
MDNSAQLNHSTVDVESKSLFSVFQPIYSFSNQACIGVEALIRGRSTETGFQVPVSECLAEPEHLTKAEYSQMINRMHLKNWQSLKLPDSWIFLNLDFEGVSSLDDLCIADLLTELKMQGHEVVIEVVESEITDEDVFDAIIQTLRQLGCLIALDDFGAG